ncbi:MAG TPA: hypothetical protein PKH33_07850 [bacterium]|nr:hypothetical protein [bacterium]
MRVFVDSVEKDFQFDGGVIFGDALAEINRLLIAEDKRIIVSLKIDDDNLADEIKKLTPDQVRVDQISQISLETEDFIQNLAGKIEDSERVLNAVQNSISSIVGHLLADEQEIAMNSLKESIDSLILVINLYVQAQALGAMNPDETPCGEGTLSDFIAKFKKTLTDLSSAMSNNDPTLINDFLEYELEPQLGELRDTVSYVAENVRNFTF